MRIETVTRDAFASYDSICIITDAQGLASLEQEFPALAPWLSPEVLSMDSETIVSFPLIQDGVKRTIYLLGLGAELSSQVVYHAFGSLAKAFSKAKATNVLVHAGSLGGILEQPALLCAAVKGLSAGSYVFNTYQNKPNAASPALLHFYTGSQAADALVPTMLPIAESIQLARELVDTPANVLKPADLATRVTEIFRETEVDVSVHDRDTMEKLGMGLYLAVAQGSDAPPKLIVMRYNGNPDTTERVGLIGKGLTYDSGGYSIKPTDGMLTMKCDMGGAAAVIGAMHLIAQERPKVNVVAVVAACENMISGHSYLPGDILTSMNGKTVEITNTDAEGRLTLADAITYAIREEGATKIVDICTLTGACMVALGHEFAGVLTWEDDLWASIHETSLDTLEPLWRLPITKSIVKMTKGKMADLMNSPGRLAGMETAGAFLGEFTEDKPWIHIDIAGPAYLDKDSETMRAGATGFGTHLLAALVSRL